MPTNYVTIDTNNAGNTTDTPVFGQRNTNSLKNAFPQLKGGKSLSVKGHKNSANAASDTIDLASSDKYKQWFYDSVVNGIIDNGGWMSNTGKEGATASEFNMNYVDSPDLETSQTAGSWSAPKVDGKVVATNYFVPVVATQNFTDIGITDTDNTTGKNASFKKAIESKVSIGAGAGGGTIVGSGGKNPRNPKTTSASTQAASAMTLGKFLKVAPQNPAG